MISALSNLGFAAFGAIVGWWLTRLDANRKDRQRKAEERKEDLLNACSKLRRLMQRWKVAIDQAVDPDLTPEQILSRLRDLDINGDFEHRIQEQLAELEGDPVHDRLKGNIMLFKARAFEGKRSAADQQLGRVYSNIVLDNSRLHRLAATAASSESARTEYLREIQDALFALYKGFEEQINNAEREIRNR